MELVLNDFIALTFKKPEALSSRMMFDGKLRLLESVGFLPTEIVAAFREVNTRRNRIAHDLHAEVPDTIARDLVRSVDSSLVRAMWNVLYNDGENREMQTPEGELRMWFYGVVQAAAYVLLRRRFDKAHGESLLVAEVYLRVGKDLTGDPEEDRRRADERHGIPRRPEPSDVWYRQAELSRAWGDPPAWSVPIARN